MDVEQAPMKQRFSRVSTAMCCTLLVAGRGRTYNLYRQNSFGVPTVNRDAPPWSQFGGVFFVAAAAGGEGSVQEVVFSEPQSPHRLTPTRAIVKN
jgi:hypothetical protein